MFQGGQDKIKYHKIRVIENCEQHKKKVKYFCLEAPIKLLCKECQDSHKNGSHLTLIKELNLQRFYIIMSKEKIEQFPKLNEQIIFQKQLDECITIENYLNQNYELNIQMAQNLAKWLQLRMIGSQTFNKKNFISIAKQYSPDEILQNKQKTEDNSKNQYNSNNPQIQTQSNDLNESNEVDQFSNYTVDPVYENVASQAPTLPAQGDFLNRFNQGDPQIIEQIGQNVWNQIQISGKKNNLKDFYHGEVQNYKGIEAFTKIKFQLFQQVIQIAIVFEINGESKISLNINNSIRIKNLPGQPYPIISLCLKEVLLKPSKTINEVNKELLELLYYILFGVDIKNSKIKNQLGKFQQMGFEEFNQPLSDLQDQQSEKGFSKLQTLLTLEKIVLQKLELIQQNAQVQAQCESHQQT